MLLSEEKLKKVKVETRSGQYLGLVNGFEVETDTGVIEKFYVKNKKLITGLFGDNLIINKSQIISFDDKKMIVEDGIVKTLVREKKILNRIENTTPVITSKES
jgi:sporulation protein YlmC with PRC-barrel domain